MNNGVGTITGYAYPKPTTPQPLLNRDMLRQYATMGMVRSKVDTFQPAMVSNVVGGMLGMENARPCADVE